MKLPLLVGWFIRYTCHTPKCKMPFFLLLSCEMLNNHAPPITNYIYPTPSYLLPFHHLRAWPKRNNNNHIKTTFEYIFMYTDVLKWTCWFFFHITLSYYINTWINKRQKIIKTATPQQQPRRYVHLQIFTSVRVPINWTTLSLLIPPCQSVSLHFILCVILFLHILWVWASKA